MKYVLFLFLYFFSTLACSLDKLPPLKADDIKLAVDFFGALKDCKSGHFNTVFQSATIEANIIGLQKDICVVELSRKYKDQLIKKRCECPPVSLMLLSDKAIAVTSAFVKKNVQDMLGQSDVSSEVSIDNAKDIETIVKTFNKYCKSI